MYLQKRFKKRVIGLAVSLIIVGQVQATTISTASTDQQSLTPGEDLDITSTGSITVPGCRYCDGLTDLIDTRLKHSIPCFQRLRPFA